MLIFPVRMDSDILSKVESEIAAPSQGSRSYVLWVKVGVDRLLDVGPVWDRSD